MKTPLLLIFSLVCFQSFSQITTPIVKAGFGVDADLRTNFFNGFVQSGNDDWFGNGTAGTGQFVIDTNGAAAMMNRWMTDANSRKLPFFRTMRVPQMSVVNNRLWIDAIYIRDYNGTAGGDSTAFVTSNKNGDNPQVWSGGITSVLDKNDIAEMMVHVRRAGPEKTDSLWFFGGISLQGTSGNRYFDFELYQTDIFYTRGTGKFTGYGAEAGHTAWLFDAAGNVERPGDIIFSAEFSSSSLSLLEARIWVHRSEITKPVQGFIWTGSFDGASNSAEYGYAGIRPLTAGDFYTGMQSGNNTWAGPFGFVNNSNNIVTTYTARQFMEFSVNLTKLGLDPITLMGGSACGLPFRRILVKTRSSTSFTSELKDFIGPFDFFVTPPVQAQAEVPLFCGVMGVSNISVTNPLPSSVYTWTTPNGNIVSSNTGEMIQVDTTGMYIVSQQLLDGCSSESRDTIYIAFDSSCTVLANNILNFKGEIQGKKTKLSWSAVTDNTIGYFDIERSIDGQHFELVQRKKAYAGNTALSYFFEEDISALKAPNLYYRIKINLPTGKATFSKAVKLVNSLVVEKVIIHPNPARNYLNISMMANKKSEVNISVIDLSGQMILRQVNVLQPGVNQFSINEVNKWQPGLYILKMETVDGVEWHKLVISQSR